MKKYLLYPPLLAATLLMGCSHPLIPHRTTEEHPLSQSPLPTTLEIHYTLGHAHRRLLIESGPEKIQARTELEGALLKQSQINPASYQSYLLKVVDFMDKHRSPASSGECRSPYTIVMKSPEKTQAIQGCRMSDAGAFSHLVQEGEFLIYREKGNVPTEPNSAPPSK